VVSLSSGSLAADPVGGMSMVGVKPDELAPMKVVVIKAYDDRELGYSSPILRAAHKART
jgi:hypothetical protein